MIFPSVALWINNLLKWERKLLNWLEFFQIFLGFGGNHFESKLKRILLELSWLRPSERLVFLCLLFCLKLLFMYLSVSYISDTSTGTKPSFYTALWTRTKIYPKRPLKLCEYTSNGWSQSVSDHFPVTKRALSVKFFSFSQSKKNVHDENMNSLTLAGETSPPKSNDKRLVHTYLLMSVLLLIKSVFESKLLSSFIGWESTNKSPTENKMCKKLKLKICENYVSLQ